MALRLKYTNKVIGILPGTGKTTPCLIAYVWLKLWKRKYDEDMACRLLLSGRMSHGGPTKSTKRRRPNCGLY